MTKMSEEPSYATCHYVVVFGLMEPFSEVVQNMIRSHFSSMGNDLSSRLVFDFWTKEKLGSEEAVTTDGGVIVRYFENISQYLSFSDTAFVYVHSLIKGEKPEDKKKEIQEAIDANFKDSKPKFYIASDLLKGIQ